MNNNNVSDRGKNKNDLFTKITKNSLPNLLFRKKKWQIIRDQSHSSQNILHNNISDNHNKPINLQMQKLKTSNNLDDANFHKNKKNRIWIINKYNYKIKNFQNFMENDKKTQTSNENEEKNNIEPILLMEIEEIKKELEKNESTFIYNQKLMHKQLEEKQNEINLLKNELINEKNNKNIEFENKLQETNIHFINTIKEYQRQIESLKNKNQELIEQNYEKEKIIENLEKKSKDQLMQLNDANNRYNILINEKAKDFISDELKQYMDNLNQKIEEQQKEINAMNEDMTYLNQENRRLKFLTREIIQARNETEIFFLDALNEAKKDLYKLKKENNKRGFFFPTLKNFYETSHQKIDIRELTPQMREQILRNLFEKINKSYFESYYKELNNIMQIDLSDNDNND